MFTRLRLQLSAQFVLLSALIFAILAVCFVLFFYSSLTRDLDIELEEESELALNLIKIDGDKANLESYQAAEKANKFHINPTVQVWSTDKELIANIGPAGVKKYFDKTTEVEFRGQKLRTYTRPFSANGADKPEAYLQVQMSTSIRDQSLNQFLSSMLFSLPFLIAGLSAAGYYLSGVAIKPVQQSFEAQKRFLGDAGHELKTPISVIRASLDNIDKSKEESAVDEKRFRRISKAVSRIEKLVSDLLLLTKTEQGLGRPEFQELDLDMLLREVLGEIGDLFEEKDVTLEADEIAKIKISGNRTSLYALFTNLIKNAMIYTNEGGKVNVSLAKSGNRAVVEIKDTGIGISEEDIPKLFDRFFRADQSRSETAVGGSNGLGLAIAKAVVDQHSGKIEIRSQLNIGTTFIIYLPI